MLKTNKIKIGIILCLVSACIVAAVYAQNYCGGVVVLSSATPTPSSGIFPQFSTQGKVLTNYTGGASLFPRSWFFAWPLGGAPDLTPARMALGGLNILEVGSLFADPCNGNCNSVPAPNCNASTFNLLGPATACASPSYDSYAFTQATNNFNSIVSWWNSVGHASGIGVMGQLPGSTCLNIDTTGVGSGGFANSYTHDFVTNLTGSTFSGSVATPAPPGMMVNYVGADEIGGCGAPNSSQIGWFSTSTTGSGGSFGLGVGTTSPHIPMMQEPREDLGNNGGWTVSTVADSVDWETGNNVNTLIGNVAGTDAQKTATILAFDLSADRTTAQLNRPSIPYELSLFTTGPYFVKGTSGNSNYTPGVDCDAQNGNSTTEAISSTSPGEALDQVFFAVAHGYAGARIYDYDSNNFGATASPNSRHHLVACPNLPTTPGYSCETSAAAQACTSSYGQTGSSDITTWTNEGSIGQDRYNATAAGFNLIHTLEPYILQPSMAAPDTAPGHTGAACLTYQNSSFPSLGIVCGAKNGNGGRLVVIINYSTNASTFVYDPSPYFQGATTAQSWVLTSNMDHTCGWQFYNHLGAANYTASGSNDCGIGPTCFSAVNGETTGPINSACGTGGTAWAGPGNALPAAGVAPNTITTLNMQPGEVDVFLYHS